MIKLMIVDDEYNIRMGLQSMIERKFPEVYSFRFAEDGRDALEQLEEDPADIIITDIRMPIMDGITLLSHIQQFPYKPEVLLLSGYDDFQYAQKAIRYQVRDYLLKPVVREELYSFLEKMKIEILDRKLQNELLTVSSPSDWIANVLNSNSNDSSETYTNLLNAGYGWMEGQYILGIICIRQNDLISMLLSEAENIIISKDKEGNIIIVAQNKNELLQLAEELKKLGEREYRIALSSSTEGIQQLRKAYSEAKQTMKYFLVINNSEVLFYDHIIKRSSNCELPLETIRRLSNLLGTDRLPEVKQLLQQILNIQVISHCEIGYLERISVIMNEDIFDKVYRCYGQESIHILRLYSQVGHIGNFQRFEDYYKKVEELLVRLDAFVKVAREQSSQENKSMQKAINYVHKHFAEDLNMAVVSNQLSLNYTYFSHAFKEYTGTSFSSYLRNFRLEKAKELLAGSDLKVYEISQQVGFDNVKHFIRIFKESEGITALEYRNQNQQPPKKTIPYPKFKG
ncbi:response regulator [Paenibacillus sp. NPDC058177]|uniref:response regulator n=1 Tax=Paenibacillus sp. NPDC058177 TaxID=3346369 RepID=UPI0036DF6442